MVFKSKYNYFLAVLRLLFLLTLFTCVLLFIFIGVPSLVKQHSGIKALGLISCGFLLFGYLIVILGKSVLTQRYNIVIGNGQTILYDNFLGRNFLLNENFKGFSFSSYGDGRSGYAFKVLIFYFSNGRKIEMPQFLYTNFKDIMPSLIAASVTYLGEEPFLWKNLFSRKYHFD